ncbi:MAG: adenosylcobinamide-GDP ribazoletransferase, partial [Haloferacaceae archaeon]
LRGALAFLTRLPVGGDEAAWDAFRRTPAAFTLAGYVVGGLAALPFLLPVPAASVAALYLVGLYLLTGVTHADGLADLGDAAAVHVAADGASDGDARSAADRRRAVLKDAATGVGGVLALALSLVALAFGAFEMAGTGPAVAVRLAVAAEVSAKAGVATAVCLGDAAHEGLGSAVVDESGVTSLVPALLVALPAAAFAPAGGTTALAVTVAAGPVVALVVARWSRRLLGGVSGDVLGATNELGRVVAVHAGVVAWTLS